LKVSSSNLPLLRSLDVLLEELNVSNAAGRLGVAQSTLSSQLARLRKLFGDELLVPSEQGRGMVLTDRGTRLRSSLHAALEALDTVVAESEVFDPQTRRRRFVIAINDNALALIGNEFIGAIVDQYPKAIQFSLIAPDPSQLISQMERGEVDMYVGAARLIPPRLKARELLSDQFCVVQRKDHPRGSKPLSMEAYLNMLHIVVSRKGELNTPIDEALATLGQTRHVAMSVYGYAQIAAMVSMTNCVATIPSRLACSWGEGFICFDPPFELAPFSLAMAWHPRSHGDVAHQWLRNQIAACSESMR